MTSIQTAIISIEKRHLTKNHALIAIDSGNSLIKVLFLNKANKDQYLNENITTFTFEFNLFNNRDFESAMKFIYDNSYQPEDNNHKIHITGVGAVLNKEIIKSILKNEVVEVDEFMTISLSHKGALQIMGIDKLRFSHIDVESYGKLESDTLEMPFGIVNQKVKHNIEGDVTGTSSEFPCVFHVHGSSSGCFYFDENGTAEYLGILNHGGKNFIGLGKCLLDTNDYEEIIELASRGNKSKVDTLVRHMLDKNADSPYGKLPADLPLFSFGQCGDFNIGLDELCKEDIALALIGYHVQQFISFCIMICMLKKVPKVYVTGNIFRSQLFEREVKHFLNLYPVDIEFIFLNFGYFGPLGALLYDGNYKSLLK